MQEYGVFDSPSLLLFSDDSEDEENAILKKKKTQKNDTNVPVQTKPRRIFGRTTETKPFRECLMKYKSIATSTPLNDLTVPNSSFQLTPIPKTRYSIIRSQLIVTDQKQSKSKQNPSKVVSTHVSKSKLIGKQLRKSTHNKDYIKNVESDTLNGFDLLNDSDNSVQDKEETEILEEETQTAESHNINLPKVQGNKSVLHSINQLLDDLDASVKINPSVISVSSRIDNSNKVENDDNVSKKNDQLKPLKVKVIKTVDLSDRLLRSAMRCKKNTNAEVSEIKNVSVILTKKTVDDNMSSNKTTTANTKSQTNKKREITDELIVKEVAIANPKSPDVSKGTKQPRKTNKKGNTNSKSQNNIELVNVVNIQNVPVEENNDMDLDYTMSMDTITNEMELENGTETNAEMDKTLTNDISERKRKACVQLEETFTNEIKTKSGRQMHKINEVDQIHTNINTSNRKKTKPDESVSNELKEMSQLNENVAQTNSVPVRRSKRTKPVEDKKEKTVVNKTRTKSNKKLQISNDENISNINSEINEASNVLSQTNETREEGESRIEFSQNSISLRSQTRSNQNLTLKSINASSIGLESNRSKIEHTNSNSVKTRSNRKPLHTLNMTPEKKEKITEIMNKSNAILNRSTVVEVDEIVTSEKKVRKSRKLTFKNNEKNENVPTKLETRASKTKTTAKKKTRNANAEIELQQYIFHRKSGFVEIQNRSSSYENEESLRVNGRLRRNVKPPKAYIQATYFSASDLKKIRNSKSKNSKSSQASNNNTKGTKNFEDLTEISVDINSGDDTLVPTTDVTVDTTFDTAGDATVDRNNENLINNSKLSTTSTITTTTLESNVSDLSKINDDECFKKPKGRPKRNIKSRANTLAVKAQSSVIANPSNIVQESVNSDMTLNTVDNNTENYAINQASAKLNSNFSKDVTAASQCSSQQLIETQLGQRQNDTINFNDDEPNEYNDLNKKKKKNKEIIQCVVNNHAVMLEWCSSQQPSFDIIPERVGVVYGLVNLTSHMCVATCGYLIFGPSQEKSQVPKKHAILYKIEKGRASVWQQFASKVMEVNYTFYVPLGSPYKIKNISDTETLILYFTKLSEP